MKVQENIIKLYWLVIILILVVGANTMSCGAEQSRPTRICIFDDPNYYASFPEILYTKDKLVVYFEVQPLDKLSESGLHPHYQPVATIMFAVSTDRGRTWTVTEECPKLGSVLYATRTCAALDEKRIIDTRFRYINDKKDTYDKVQIFEKELYDKPIHVEDIPEANGLKSNMVWDLRKLRDGTFLGAALGYRKDVPKVVDEGKSYQNNWPEDKTMFQLNFIRDDANGKNWKIISQIENNHAFGMAEPRLFM